jgi:putative hemolysin
VDFLRLEEDDSAWAQTIHDTRHTLYPVCEDSADNVIGILNAKDYFRLEDRNREAVLNGAVKEAYFVPESIKADVLFKNMRRQHIPLAVVLDEYGGMVGIVTITDLVEQLVGNLDDDTDRWDVRSYERLKENEKPKTEEE